MFKLLFVILAAAMMATFAMDNMQRVELGLVVGKPVHVRLFFLLLASFLIGCFSTVFTNLYLGTRYKKGKATSRDSNSDEFFSE